MQCPSLDLVYCIESADCLQKVSWFLLMVSSITIGPPIGRFAKLGSKPSHVLRARIIEIVTQYGLLDLQLLSVRIRSRANPWHWPLVLEIPILDGQCHQCRNDTHEDDDEDAADVVDGDTAAGVILFAHGPGYKKILKNLKTELFREMSYHLDIMWNQLWSVPVRILVPPFFLEGFQFSLIQ